MAICITLTITADILDACEPQGDETTIWHGYEIPEDAADLLGRYVEEVERIARREWKTDDVTVLPDCAKIRRTGATRAHSVENSAGAHWRDDETLQSVTDEAWVAAWDDSSAAKRRPA